MRFISILIISFLLLVSNAFGQTRTITGKIIDEDLEVIPEVRIQNSDTLIFGTTDINGKFKIEIPVQTTTLLIRSIGFESKPISLINNCAYLDIILMYAATYDYISARKVNRLRIKRFKKLPELHLTAYKKGIFLTEKPCYEQIYIPTKQFSN